MDTQGEGPIDTLQFRVHFRGTAPFELVPYGRAHERIHRRDTREAAEEGIDVQSGTTHEKRDFPPFLDIPRGEQGLPAEIPRGEPAIRVDDIDEVMSHELPLGRRGLPAPDIQTTVHLHRIGGDNFKDIAGKSQGKIRFPGRRGPHQYSSFNGRKPRLYNDRGLYMNGGHAWR